VLHLVIAGNRGQVKLVKFEFKFKFKHSSHYF
jgi:hypothetical protein